MSVERSEFDVERSAPAPRGAVFLSYASQDAEAARKICEALRAVGVEVWFDQSELVGGDAWDAKIRKQIGSCALFVPLISATTQARAEGYFRLEWRLADKRMDLMGKSKAFLLPVCIDGTRDAEADVPDSFLAVQWTRLPGGETTPAFCARVKQLVEGRPASRVTSAPAVSAAPGQPAHPAGRSPLRSLALAGVVVAMLGGAGLWFWQPWTPRAQAKAAPVASASPPEIAALRARIVPDRWQKGDFEAVDATIERLLQQNPENADAWALRSIICSLQTMRLIDRGTKPLQEGRRAAERAQSLAPDSPLANLALGYHLTANINRGGDPEAGRAPMDRAVAALPADALTRYGALASVWNAYDLKATGERALAWLAAEPTATFPAWVLSSMSNVARRPDDVLSWGERVTSDPNITGVRAYSTMFDALFYLRADLPAATAMLDRVPPRGRTVPRIVFCRWLLASAQGRHDDALQAIAAVPEAFIGDVSYAGPKALLAALSHRWAGRAEPAAVQFREAERLLRERLVIDPDAEEFRIELAMALAALGREGEARNELALIEPILRGRSPSLYRGQLFSLAFQTYAMLGDAAGAAYYLRRIFTEPSHPPHTPASLQLDPRFRGVLEIPELRALLREFETLNPRSANPAASATATTDDKSAPADKSVAVLAFANLSDDKANEYFSDGISEELLNVLAKVPGLKVSARTSAFYFKGRNTPIPEIAKQLGVAYVVEGSVRRSGDRVRITAQLIKAADGFHVWSETFTRDLKDVFAVQDEIAGLIAQNLSLRMGVTSSAPSLDAEVLPLYYAALQAWNLRTLEGMDRAEALLNDALARSPQFARGHAALAAVWLIRGEIQDTISPFGLRSSPLAGKIAAKLEEALRLDPNCAEAFAVRGAFGWDTWAWEQALADLRRATELNPNFASAYQWMGRVFASQGRLAEAIPALQRAAELDPLSPRILDNYGRMLLFAGRASEALAAAERALELQPGAVQARGLKAEALLQLGQREAAAELARTLPTELPIVSIYKVNVLAAAGRPAELEAMLPHFTNGGHISRIAALTALGRHDEALDALDPHWITATRIDMLLCAGIFDPLRRDPRFAAALERLGLTESHARAQAWRAKHRPAQP